MIFRSSLLWIARRIAEHYGYQVVVSTPFSLLPSRVTALSEAVRRSGHLGHRFHVRRTLDRLIDDVMDKVMRAGTVSW